MARVGAFPTDSEPPLLACRRTPQPSLDETCGGPTRRKARIERIATLVNDYLPWLKPEYAPIQGLLFEKPAPETALHAVPRATPLRPRCRLWRNPGACWPRWNSASPPRVSCLNRRRSPRLIARLRLDLARARARLTALIARACERFLRRPDASPTIPTSPSWSTKTACCSPSDTNSPTGKIHWACYDMLASEARIATYIAVARGELSQQGWFKMSRVHTQAYGHSVLLSWTGTMFEYLMPALWMRSYPDTLLSNSIQGAVAIQRAYAKEHGIPWGISESGYAAKTEQGHYHYQAYGIPQIALKWDATAGPVGFALFHIPGAERRADCLDPESAPHGGRELDRQPTASTKPSTSPARSRRSSASGWRTTRACASSAC